MNYLIVKILIYLTHRKLSQLTVWCDGEQSTGENQETKVEKKMHKSKTAEVKNAPESISNESFSRIDSTK